MSKKFGVLVGLVVVGLIFWTSCKQSVLDQRLGDYAIRATFPGLGRQGAVAFVIGTKAYVGTGYNGPNNTWLKDFWEFDGLKNSWRQVADFPGEERYNAVAFSSEGKGYVGTGYDGFNNVDFNDFYSYDPGTNTWTQIANLPGASRKQATSFQVKDRGYVGLGQSTDLTGLTNDLRDFYTYDPKSNSWSAVTAYPGPTVQKAFSFSIGSYAYVGGGLDNNKIDYHFYRFDPSNNTWLLRSRLDSNSANVNRYDCASFASEQYGYVVQGITNYSGAGTCYEYNPSNDAWTRKTDMETSLSGGGARSGLVGFAIPGITDGYNLFVGLGTGSRGNALAGSTAYADFWGFNPFVTVQYFN